MSITQKSRRLPANLTAEQVKRIGINNYVVRMYEYNLMVDDMASVIAKVNEVDAEGYKGVINCSTNPNYPASSINWYYRVSVAGKIGGAGGIDVEVGDVITCIATSAAGDHATVGGNFMITQKNMVYLTAANMIASPSGTSDYVTAKTLTDLGLTFATTNKVAIAGGTSTQLLLTSTAAQKGMTINGSAQTQPLVDITATVADVALIASSLTLTKSAAFTAANALTGYGVTITGTAADVDDSHHQGFYANIIGVSTSRSDYAGVRVVIGGTFDAAAGTQNVVGFGFTPTCTLNGANVDMYGINMDFTGMTNTASNDVYGIRVISSGQLDRSVHIYDGTREIILGATGTQSAVSIGGTVTTGINFISAANLVGVMKFDAIAGAVIANALVPATAPDGTTMGADACLTVYIGATPYYIPLYDTLHA